MSNAWSPQRMPKIRDQITRNLLNPTGTLRLAYPDNQQPFDALAEHFPTADLWWVAPNMAALAVSAAATIPEVGWGCGELPSTSGLLIWDGGIGNLTYADLDYPVDAASWNPGPNGGFMVWLWVSRTRVDSTLAPDGLGVDHTLVPPLLPIAGVELKSPSQSTPTGELRDWYRTPIATLASTWHLAAQPKLADREHVRPDRDLVRAYSRAGREPCEVLLVDLRRRYVPNQGSNPEADLNRQYRHRWVVSGHWRDQACGKEWSERKRIWVSDHVKGPDGAPLLATTRVNVWRR